MRHFYRLVAGAAILWLPCVPAHAQRNPPAPDSGAVIQTETKLVLVDAIITDKKGSYIRDLTAKEFRVWEDNKEQIVRTFSFEADPASTARQKRYLVLFFDNSTMNPGDQARARQAAAKFIETNAGPDRLMAIVNFGGVLQVAQNFTEDAERLKSVVSGLRVSSVSPREDAGVPSTPLSRVAADFGARDMILALRNLAKSLNTISGRKSLILFTAGFPVRPDQISEVTAAIDACNKSNVAVYPIDVRGLVAPVAWNAPNSAPGGLRSAVLSRGMLASFVPVPVAFFQRGGAGGGGQTGPGAGGPGGGRGGPISGGGPPAGGGAGRGAPGAPSSPPAGGGAPRTPGGVNPGNPAGSARGPGMGGTPLNRTIGFPPFQTNPYNQSRGLIPRFPDSVTTNQQLLYMLADGTGGFVIHNTNDLLGGLEKIAKEQNEYYVLGYTPPEASEGSCHVLRVKVDRSGATVRARTGYCYAKPHDLLVGDPVEKTLENHASSPQPGNATASMLLPFFYTSPDEARVNLALEIDPQSLKFEKQKGKFHAAVNFLGVAYTQDGKVAARFSDTLKLDLADKKEVEKFQETPLHYENQFDVASGRYNFKLVFTSGGSNFGKLETPLVVEPYQTQEFGLSGLALSREARAASAMDLALDASLLEDRKPLLYSNLQIIPTGSNRFKRGEQAIFYFEVYEPLLVAPDPKNPAKVAIQMRVLDRKSGEQKVDTGPMTLDFPADSGNPVIPVGEKMPVATLPPGAYVLELQAADIANRSARRSIDFDIQ